VIDFLCAALEEELPAAKNATLRAKGIRSYSALKAFVPDRPGHDRRYAIDASKSVESWTGNPGTILPPGYDEPCGGTSIIVTGVRRCKAGNINASGLDSPLPRSRLSIHQRNRRG